MSTGAQLDPAGIEIDALREVANIASGHAATALGQLTDRAVWISIPEFTLTRAEEVPQVLGYADRKVVVVAMQVLGDVTGSLVFLMPDERARRLAGLLLGQTEPAEGEFDGMIKSSLMETANIICGAYAGALASLTGRMIMLSVPTFGVEPPDEVLAGQDLTKGQLGLCIESSLSLAGETVPFGGHILLLPHPAALRLILDALHVF
ncbi:MAG TPA: chemotaxis protein CheC [Gemmatimonadales bacterium]|nr:chemotaxis protein CheC [Gemmatimonadales bacterium]